MSDKPSANVKPVFAIAEVAIQPEQRWRDTIRLFCANRAALFGLVAVAVFVFVGLFGPVIFPADPFDPVAAPLSAPGEYTLLGTDYLGRDVFLGIIHGTRPTLLIAAIATLVTVLIGITLGSVAGYFVCHGYCRCFLQRYGGGCARYRGDNLDHGSTPDARRVPQDTGA